LLSLFDNANQLGPGFVGENMGQGLGFGGIGVDLSMRTQLRGRFIAIRLKPNGSQIDIEAFDALGNPPLKASAPVEMRDGWAYLGRVTQTGLGLMVSSSSSSGSGLAPGLLQTSTSLRLRKNPQGFLLVEKIEHTDGLVVFVPYTDGEGSYSRFAPARPMKTNPMLATAAPLTQTEKLAPAHWRGKPIAFPTSLWLRPWGEKAIVPSKSNKRDDFGVEVVNTTEALVKPMGMLQSLDEPISRGGFQLKIEGNLVCLYTWQKQKLTCQPFKKQGDGFVINTSQPPYRTSKLLLRALDTGGLLVVETITSKTIKQVRKGSFLGMGGTLTEEVEVENNQNSYLLSGF
jgi:hypothetical protein